MLGFRNAGRGALAVLVVVLAGCLGSSGDGERATWSAAFDTGDTLALFGVWGSAPDDVFIVGGSEDEAVIHHYDGSEWSRMDPPEGVAALIWVTGFGPDDVYAVGLRGAVVHYDGSEWRALDSGTEDDLWGIFGFDDSEMWLVGGDPFKEEPSPTVLRYDGARFERVEIDPDENSRGARALFKVWGIGERIFLVGQRGQIFERSGDEWVNSPGGADADQDFVSLWGTSEDEIVMVGGRSNARLSTYDGEGWTTRAESGLGGLNGVHMVRPGEAIIGGVEGFVGRYDVASDTIIEEAQDVTTLDVHAVWGDGEGTTYAVGGEFLPPFAGAALVRTME